MEQSSENSDDDLGPALQQWAADAAVDEAARARWRARWLEIQASEEATLAGTLLDLAERAAPVVITVGEHRIRSVISGMGIDFVTVRAPQGSPTLIPLGAIDAVTTEPGGPAVRGDRDGTVVVNVSLAGVVVPMAADRPDVVVHASAPSPIRGVLRAAGADVLQVRSGDERPTTTWIPLAAVRLMSVR